MWEIAIVLALSLGASAVISIVSILERVTRETALSEQTTTIHGSLAERPGFDLTYQLVNFTFGLAPVVLVIFLLWRSRPPHLGGLGFGAPVNATPRRGPWWLRETGHGVGLAALIGIPGLAFYIVASLIGMNVTVVPAAIDTHWWTVPVLILHALRAALVEELIVVAYLFERFKRLGTSPLVTIITSALLRGSYHLYQGFGGFIGNIIMGLVFGWFYHRYGRSLPLVIAHWVLDIVSFVGFAFALAWWPEVFAPK